MKCPVCGKEICTAKSLKCKNCSFDDIRTEFINDEERLFWEKYVVYPCKFAYEMNRELRVTVGRLNKIIDEAIKSQRVTNNGTRDMVASSSDLANESNTTLSKQNFFITKDVIFEDENLKVIFIQSAEANYLGGHGINGKFVFENKTAKRYCVYLKDVSFGGYICKEQGDSVVIPKEQKMISEMVLVFENQILGKFKDYSSIEFKVCYGEIKEGLRAPSNIIGRKIESDIISISIN